MANDNDLKMLAKIDDLNARAWKIHVNEPNLALKLSSEAKDLATTINYKKGIAYATRNIGVSYRYVSKFETALSISLEALDMFDELGDKSGESQALVSIGAIYYYMGDYDKGLDYFLKGLKVGEEIGNKEAVTYAYNGAGYIYNLFGDFEKGLDFLHQSLKLCREIKNSSLEASILDSIASTYLSNGQLDKAYETYKTCLEFSEQNNVLRNQGYAFSGIGVILFKKDKPDEAKYNFLKSLEIHTSIGYQIGMAHSLLHLGRIFLNQKKFEESLNYLHESLNLGESIKAKVVIYESHEALSILYQSLKDFDKFVEHYKLYFKYKSEVFKEELETKQKYQNIQYEVEKLKQDAEISRLTNVVMKEKNEELEKQTEELEKSYNSVSLLSKIGQDITSTINLETILNTIYKNVNEMMDATIFGIGILKPGGENIEYRLSMEKGKRYQPYERSMEDKNQFPVWCIDNKSEVFINDIETEYSKYLPNMDMAMMNSAEMEDGSRPEEPHSLIYLPLIVKDKIIGLISVQSYHKNAYTPYHLNILKTLASYASAALYNAQSYLMLQDTLDELKVTQEQLIQQEKLASLGQLTAGIAHEIKNPLNFVNNFSDVSIEMIDEVLEELKKIEENEQIILATSILTDIKSNLNKIHEHGTRADSIVKSMLMHSRGGSGKMEPTDLNALVKEYVNLAFHGMRAGKDPIDVEIDLKLDESIGKIPLIADDFSRAILNLCNNAFDAMRDLEVVYRNRMAGDTYELSDTKPTNDDREPGKSTEHKIISETYAPKLTVRTFRETDKITIEIEDNGPGISDDIKDKIMQPFFTTKKGTQGTGLGLSITNDIIKVHGGILDIDSTFNGAKMKIILSESSHINNKNGN
jgi:signal transduction histidine kinase/tetratricopeptide (TPR) repeat protein